VDEPGGPTNPPDTPEEVSQTPGETPGTASSQVAETGETAAETGAAEAEVGTGAAEAGVGATEAGAGAAAEAGAGAAAEAGAGATGTGAAGAGAAAGAPVILIVLAVILIIIIVIGVAGFFTTVPQMLWNRFKEFALDLWDGLQGYFIGMDEALVNKDDILGAAQYLYDMGYDLVGMGFAEKVTIVGQKDENGNIVPEDDEHVENEIIDIDAPYLRAYLVAENRTYLINNYTFSVSDAIGSIFDGSFFEEGTEAFGTGLIDLDDGLLGALLMPIKAIRIADFNIGEWIDGVKIIREANQMRIRRLNLELAFWKSHFDYTFYSLEGWSGRYGKPFELMITLHVATMAPDLVKEFALNEDLDAKVHIKMRDVTFGGTVYVDGVPISDLQTGYDEETGEWIGQYSEETMDWLQDLQKDKAEEIKTSIPYISSVTNHWFRNVYFEGTDSTGASNDTDVGIDGDLDGLEDFNESTGEKTQKSRKLSSDDNVYKTGDDVEATMEYTDDDIPAELEGKKITTKGTMEDGISQTKEGVRGLTNPTTKAIFKGGTVDGKTYEGKYYIYDGTVERAKAIQAARRGENNGVVKEEVNLTKESLRAFTILEGSETLDAQFIYRDLKELVIEIGYFEREDFYEIEKQVLEWPIPEYIPADWPNKEIEKQILEYGSIIACDETIAYSLGMSLEDLQEMTDTEDDEEDEEDDELKALKGMTFIGDEYIKGLKENVDIKDAEFFYAEQSGPQYWLDHIASLPDNLRKVVIATGSNDPKKYESMKGLIDALDEKYEGIQIYVIEVMHATENYQNVDEYNKLIDTYNSHVRNKCKIQKNATLIDASLGFLSNGYLTAGDSDGRHLDSGSYENWAKNIAREIKENKISNNETDEQFVVDFLKAANEITKRIDEENYEYGSAEFMPPKPDGTTNSDGSKKISCDRMVSWALNKCGYTDTPECGLCVSAGGTFIEYCEDKEWKRIDNIDEVQAGDIVFTGQLDDEGMKARHVFICAGENQRYDCGSQDRIRLEGSYSGYASQPFNEPISSDFMCAYRVTGNGLINSGFKEDLEVIAMGNGKVTEVLSKENNLFSEEYLAKTIYGDKVITQTENDIVPGREQSQEGLRIKLTDNALRGYILIIYGFDVNDNIKAGDSIKVGEVIGKTLNSDINIILLDRDKGVIDNVEEYIKVPKKGKNDSGGIYAAFNEEITEEEMEFLATVLIAENGTSADTMAAVCQVIKNRGNDTVHFSNVSTVFEVLTAPGQYGCVYKVPSSGNGPTPNAAGRGLRDAPADADVFDFGEKGKYWVGNNGRPRHATDLSREVAEGVMSGTIEDKASAQMGKLALYQVTLRDYGGHDSCCVELGELYAHNWGCLRGNHESCGCTLP